MSVLSLGFTLWPRGAAGKVRAGRGDTLLKMDASLPPMVSPEQVQQGAAGRGKGYRGCRDGDRVGGRKGV